MQFYQNLRGLTAGFNCADNKKSQSALEYMMTYGWAILAIVIIIIIFYSLGIFSPTNNLSYSVTGFSPFTILSQECGNGALVLEVGNSAGSPVEILNASVINSNGIKISSLPDINYFAGIDNNFFLTFYNSACKSSDNFYSASITINYAIDTPAGEENLVSRGYIAGKSITQRLITFIESGLPAGLNWTMEYANEIKNSQQGSISFLDLGNQRFYIKNTSINGVTYYPTAFSGVISGNTTYFDFIPLRDMFVANGGSGILSVVNTSNNLIIRNISVSSNPIGVAVSPSGNPVFVTNHGNSFVSVINTDINKVIANITVGVNPTGITMNMNGSFVYATVLGNGGVLSLINATSFSIVKSFKVGGTPESIAVAPSSKFIYVTQSSSNSVSVLNSSLDLVKVIPVGDDPIGIAVSPDGRFAYVANNLSNTVSVINLSSYDVIKNISVGSGPESIAVSPTGESVYVVNTYSNNVYRINASSYREISIIGVGSSPSGLTINPNNEFVYVSNFGSDTVSVISTSSNSVIDSITGFKSPQGIADAPSGSN